MFQSASSVRRLPGVIAVLVVALALTGCSTATEQLEAAVSDASSAVSTARLATKQQAKDRTFLPTTQTALGDAVTALNDAAASAARVEPTGTTEVELQQRALTVIRGGTDAVLAAQRTITSDAGQAIPGLAESADTLTHPRRRAREGDPMKRLLGVALGVLTAIGGFLDIGDLVTNAVVGSRFGLSLAWVVIVGVVGICVFAQMSGRVAAVSGRATFEIIRERLGPRAGLANLGASFLINLLTLTAEIGGIALALQLASSVEPALWIPVAAFAVWLVVWRVKFSVMENVTGLLGLTLIVFAVAVFLLHPNWGELATQALTPSVPGSESGGRTGSTPSPSSVPR